jgi:hypothetical protein
MQNQAAIRFFDHGLHIDWICRFLRPFDIQFLRQTNHNSKFHIKFSNFLNKGQILAVKFDSVINPFEWNYGYFFLELVAKKWKYGRLVFTLKAHKTLVLNIISNKEDKYEAKVEEITFDSKWEEDYNTMLSESEIKSLLKTGVFSIFSTRKQYTLSTV